MGGGGAGGVTDCRAPVQTKACATSEKRRREPVAIVVLRNTHRYCGSVFADAPRKNNSEVVGAGKDGAQEGEDGRNHFHLDVEDGDLRGRAKDKGVNETSSRHVDGRAARARLENCV